MTTVRMMMGWLLLGWTTTVFSQTEIAIPVEATRNDPRAVALLDKVSAQFKTFSNVRADFRLEVTEPESQEEITQKGVLYLQGDQFKMKMEEQDIICDGNTIWTFLKINNEVQVNYFEPDQEMMSPSRIFSQFDDRFWYRLKDPIDLQGGQAMVVELTPMEKDPEYFKIDLFVSKNDLLVKGSKIYTKSGIHYNYFIDEFSTDVDLPESFFRFDPSKYPGIEVIDLR